MSAEDGLPRGWELLHESFQAAFPFKDRDGRPLGEANAPEECLRGVSTEWRECKYQGGRHRHVNPMNVTALRQLTDHWAELLAGVRFLRQSYLALFDVDTMTHIHTWRLSKFATILPAYLRCRTRDRVHEGELAVPVAGLFKILAGVFQTMQHMVLFGAAMGTMLEGATSPGEILQYAEDNELLLDTKGVCAGPPNMILELLELLVTNRPAGPSDGVIADLLGDDTADFFRYAALDSAQQLHKFIFRLEWRARIFQLSEELARETPRHAITSSVRAYSQESTARSPFPIPDFLLSVEGNEVRCRLLGALRSELETLDEWAARRGSSRPNAPRVDLLTLARTSRSALEAALRNHNGNLGSNAWRVCEVLFEYLELERRVMADLQTRQAALDRMFDRAGGPFEVDSRALEVTFGETPRRALERILGVEVRYASADTVLVAGTFSLTLRAPSPENRIHAESQS